MKFSRITEAFPNETWEPEAEIAVSKSGYSTGLGLLGRLQESRDALLVAGGGVLVDDAFFGGAIDLRLKRGKELGGFVGFTGFGQGANLLLGSANGADLGTVESAATDGSTSLFGGGTGIGHSPPNWRK